MWVRMTRISSYGKWLNEWRHVQTTVWILAPQHTHTTLYMKKYLWILISTYFVLNMFSSCYTPQSRYKEWTQKNCFCYLKFCLRCPDIFHEAEEALSYTPNYFHAPNLCGWAYKSGVYKCTKVTSQVNREWILEYWHCLCPLDLGTRRLHFSYERAFGTAWLTRYVWCMIVLKSRPQLRHKMKSSREILLCQSCEVCYSFERTMLFFPLPPQLTAPRNSFSSFSRWHLVFSVVQGMLANLIAQHS